MLVGSGKTHIRRLRARSHERDALALRLRLNAALSAMDLHPPGVPASAIVCVRGLRTTRPHASSRDPSGAARSWERSVTSALSALAARAARPARGPVSEAAEAVLFADRAELMACLATDWLAGAASAGRWWWRSLLSARAGTRALVLGVWMEAPEHVPAALEHMAHAGTAEDFARSLNDSEAALLLARVAHAFGVFGLRKAFEPHAHSEAQTPGLHAEARGAGEEEARAPWHGRVEEARAHGLGREQQSLLGFGLTLARAPHVARAPAFALEVIAWLAKHETNVRRDASPKRDGDFKQHGLHETPNEREGVNQSAPGSNAEEHGREVAEASGQTRRPETAKRGGDEGAQESTVEAGPRGVREDEGRGEARPESAENLEREAVGNSRAWAAESNESVEEENDDAPPPRLLEASVATRLGGLFYLVNVGLFLELYGDFTTPLKPGLALPVWDFVALVGRELYGETVCEDPVWSLLARLAGRDADEEPGKDFTPPAGQSLGEWVGWLTGTVSERLRLALGVGDGRELARLLCEQEARVVVTASHVDVHFRLSGLPIEIRLAGLDRDPGWVPAAGRFVAFHYE
ncbi:MAG TPA: hypothetical protein VGX48_11760 [Pyrinomonadaceae bacterium]|jgi:hypothetical protein|nr:hypothetical protein [Pyrinomonadaceae bacterium]